MDALKPQLLSIGKRCYRVNSSTSNNDQQQQEPTTNEYIEDGLYHFQKTNYFIETEKNIKITDLYSERDSEFPDDFEVIEVSPNRFKISFHVPQ